MQNISLTSLFKFVLSRVAARDYSQPPGQGPTQTTIRLEPEVRAFYEDVAKELNTSLQSILSMVLKALMINSNPNCKHTIELMYERFFEVLTSHGIDVPVISEFLKDFKITRSALANKERLIDLLDTPLLNFLSETFFVELDWLRGMEGVCTTKITHDSWHESPEKFCQKLEKLMAEKQKIFFLLLHNAESSSFGFLIYTSKKSSTGIDYNTYQIFQSHIYQSKKAVDSLKAILKFIQQKKIFWKELTLPSSKFEPLFYGWMLAPEALSGSYEWLQARVEWHE